MMKPRLPKWWNRGWPFVAALALVTLAVTGVGSAALLSIKHEVKGVSYSTDCKSATITWQLFKEDDLVSLKVTRDGVVVYNTPFLVHAPGDSKVVPVDLSGDHTLQITSDWTTPSDGYGSFDSGLVHLVCSTSTTTLPGTTTTLTTTTPGTTVTTTTPGLTTTITTPGSTVTTAGATNTVTSTVTQPAVTVTSPAPAVTTPGKTTTVEHTTTVTKKALPAPPKTIVKTRTVVRYRTHVKWRMKVVNHTVVRYKVKWRTRVVTKVIEKPAAKCTSVGEHYFVGADGKGHCGIMGSG